MKESKNLFVYVWAGLFIGFSLGYCIGLPSYTQDDRFADNLKEIRNIYPLDNETIDQHHFVAKKY